MTDAARLMERLEQLRAEYRSGEQALAELESRREDLRQTLLRISGAIQVLEEVTGQTEDGDGQR
jgi:prefoldin subunit 5